MQRLTYAFPEDRVTSYLVIHEYRAARSSFCVACLSFVKDFAPYVLPINRGEDWEERVLKNNEPYKYSVISVGMIPKLLTLREAVLQSSGFIVFSTMQLPEAVSTMRSRHFDVMLLCYSVVGEWREELVKQFREYCQGGRIVAITDRPVTEPSTDVDEIVYGIEGPDALMHAIRGKAA
jgi:hypothetical protein